MAPIVNTIEIARPPEEVFAYVTDLSRLTEWQSKVVSGCLVGGGTPGVGSTCTCTRRIGGAKRTTTSRITEIRPPRRWAVRGVDGPIRATVNVTVEPLDEGAGSRLTIELDFEGHALGKVLVPLMVRRQARKELATDLRKVKGRLESRVSGAR